ncbi:hypothetical protein NNC19_21935 [Clostridium sp. SHJSY1]|uniref:hypothetical protein n=1 Tax=Clostridium sp. SHJSY1 TaxID=2942483 RepID=UPI002874EB44|nr:hypothetical protein [Clostridium sp. SHJSY1]MDS0528352.1 hypothetical protein [Clostridium sp. SHJSY1]
MLKKLISIIACAVLLSSPLSTVVANAQTTPIFQGAEGCGALAGTNIKTTVYHVKNLNDSGSGSFRDAVSKPNRTVVFDVSGTINLKSELSFASNLIINGQTAPNEGITIAGQSSSFSKAQNDVIRYVRFRQGLTGGARKCCLYIDNANNIMVDHVSIESGRWDNLHMENSKNVTIQYSIIADGVAPQYSGAILQQCDNLSIHHCLWADNRTRNPKAKSNIQFENNVIYNWNVCGFVGGHSSANHYQDLINNYFICGQKSSGNFIGECTSTDHIYNSNNYFDGNKDGVLNGRLITNNDISKAHATVQNAPYVKSVVPITLQSAADAYKTVIASAGNSLHRDSLDTKIINKVKSLGK